MFSRIARALWGDLSSDEFKKFGMLAGIFLFIIGTYWLMRPLKDALFMGIVGKLYIPYAKMASFIIIAVLIFIYSKLVDMFEKHKLVYFICGAYALLFFGITYGLSNPTIGLANTVASP